MQSFSNALGRVHEEGSWFARAHEVRLLIVRTSGELRNPVLELLSQLEWHADNRAPWLVLPDAHTTQDDGWQARANRLGKDWEQRRQAFAKEGIALAEVKAHSPSQSASPGLLSSLHRPGAGARVSPFLRTAVELARALREPLRGVVVVLAPATLENGTALEEELVELLRDPALSSFRWVLVLDLEQPLPGRILRALGDRALSCECRIDPDELDRDLEALLDESGPPGSPAAAGVARPRGVVPPRRVDDPPELPKEKRDAVLREAGIDPRYLEQAPQLRNLLLGAALAMKRGRGQDAIQKQCQARDLCESLGLHQVKVICQIALASYLSGLGQPDRAVQELEAGSASARTHGLHVQESQAQLALGLLHALAQRLPEATRAYAQAARAAEAGAAPLLAIESWRLAGQLAAQKRLTEPAAKAFQEALRIAGEADPSVAQISSAPEAARALAALFRKQRRNVQANSLEELAMAMERAMPRSTPEATSTEARS